MGETLGENSFAVPYKICKYKTQQLLSWAFEPQEENVRPQKSARECLQQFYL